LHFCFWVAGEGEEGGDHPCYFLLAKYPIHRIKEGGTEEVRLTKGVIN
jgi:hypothetical protein